MLITDTFPPPVVDPAKWTSQAAGSLVGLVVGAPVDGFFPIGVDEHDDIVLARSDGKITVPAAKPFTANLYYGDVYDDPEQNIIPFFGWRSSDKDLGGNPLHVVEIQLVVSPGPFYRFQYRIVNNGSESITIIGDDPSGGGDGGFRIVRSGSVYSLYRFDGGWTLLVDVPFPRIGEGFIEFGIKAVDPTLAAFPWVIQS